MKRENNTRGTRNAMATQKYVRRDAKALKEGIVEAEAKRNVNERPPDGMVSIKPKQIQMRPELFQPRNFAYGTRNIEVDQVKTYARRINAIGELDPPTIIKLGNTWFCVDGHHRIEAYKRAEAGWGNRPIKCFWFGGTV